LANDAGDEVTVAVAFTKLYVTPGSLEVFRLETAPLAIWLVPTALLASAAPGMVPTASTVPGTVGAGRAAPAAAPLNTSVPLLPALSVHGPPRVPRLTRDSTCTERPLGTVTMLRPKPMLPSGSGGDAHEGRPLGGAALVVEPVQRVDAAVLGDGQRDPLQRLQLPGEGADRLRLSRRTRQDEQGGTSHGAEQGEFSQRLLRPSPPRCGPVDGAVLL
jgi:hypothetical protein